MTVVQRKITLESLQAGRAVAALAVVVHHAVMAAKNFGAGLPGQQWLELGYLGVDFFFVLSGFIIYHSTVGSSKTTGRYARARFDRVYVPYFPIGIGIAVLYMLLPGLSGGLRQWSWLSTLSLFPASSPPALSVAWTLQHEVTFYFIFGLAYFSGQLSRVLTVWGVLIVVNAAFGLLDWIPLKLINLEFLMGVIVAALKERWKPHLAIGLVPAMFWFWLDREGSMRVLIGLCCAVVVWWLVRSEEAGRLKVPSWLVFLGAASYAIYLTHSVTIAAVGRLLLGQSLLIASVGFIVGTAAGVGYFILIERPLLRHSRKSKRTEAGPYPR